MSSLFNLFAGKLRKQDVLEGGGVLHGFVPKIWLTESIVIFIRNLESRKNNAWAGNFCVMDIHNFTQNLLDLLVSDIPDLSVLSLVERKITWILIDCLFFTDDTLYKISNKD